MFVSTNTQTTKLNQVAAVLIENGASLEAATKKGFQPLHLTAKYGHIKVAELLLQKGAPVDAQGKNGVSFNSSTIYQYHSSSKNAC